MTDQTIQKITVTDFMGIEGTIELYPTGSLQIIAGPNGSGKSSFIHALEECFDPQGTKAIPNPVNNNASRARVEILLTDARMVRDYPKDGPGILSVYALDGAKYASPKEFVASITGGVLFDPLDFVKLADKDQRQTLLSKVTLPFDLVEIDAKRKGFFEARTDVSRDVKRLTAQLSGFPPADPTVPIEEVSAAALVAQLDEIRAHGNLIDGRRDAAKAAKNVRVEVEARGKNLASQLEQARAAHEVAVEIEKAAEDALSGLSYMDDGPITAQLATIDDTNAKVRAQAARAAVADELELVTVGEIALTADIKRIDKTKADGLAAAAFPAGLSISDDGITFDGVPFKQLNTARQDSIAFDLATSGNPKLKVVVMKSGNDLDDVSLEAIRRLADERGYFVVMERISGTPGSVGFSIQIPEASE